MLIPYLKYRRDMVGITINHLYWAIQIHMRFFSMRNIIYII